MKKLAAMFVLILAAFALVACGGGSDTTSDPTAETTTQEESGSEKEAEGGTAGAATVDFEADPSGALAYTTDKADAKAGKVTVNFTNSSPVPHDAETEVLAEGSESTTAELKPGEYKFFCTVPGHRQGGMEGTLTVK